MATENIWTYELSATDLTIDETFGLTAISVLCTSGSIQIQGYDTAGGISSSDFRLTSNQSMTLTTNGSLNSLVLYIDATGGTCNLMGMK